MPTTRQTIGFIGIGHMGAPMAQRLYEAGYDLSIFDTNTENSNAFAAGKQVTVAADAATLASRSQYIITMLPNSVIVESVLTGPKGVLSTIKRGAIILEMSSGVPRHTQQLESITQDAGAILLDAPVSGGVSRAQQGDLSIMIGGLAAHVNSIMPILEHMGKSITHTGAVGTAHAMKALNNLLSAGGFLMGIETLLIGQRFGLDPAVMVDALNSSTGMNNSTQKKFKQFVLSRKFDSGFSMELMIKDLGIALDIAKDAGTSAPLSALCKDLWCASANVVEGKPDHTAAAKLLEILNATELHSSGT